MLRDELLRRFPRLRAAPPDAYVVGGAVRDLLSGRDPADVDLACLDPLATARDIGSRVIRLGHGEHLSAWRVVDGSHVYDVAEILDRDIGTDLGRRDFTVNAMAVRLIDGELLDPHGGRADLQARLVRMVHASNFDDDPLRCLKGVRLAIQHGLEIEPATVAAMRTRAPRIVSVAPERVTYELSLILGAGRLRRALSLLRDTALAGPLFGGAGSFAADDLALAGAYALLVPDPKPYAKRWRWSTGLLREVTALQHLLHDSSLVALYDAGEKVARQLPAALRALGRNDDVAMPDFTIRPLLDGEEIAAARGIQGPEVGRLKRALLEAQIRGEVKTRDEAVTFTLRQNA